MVVAPFILFSDVIPPSKEHNVSSVESLTVDATDNYIEREFTSIKSINDDLKRDSFKLHSIFSLILLIDAFHYTNLPSLHRFHSMK